MVKSPRHTAGNIVAPEPNQQCFPIFIGAAGLKT
jgi:hypothetical protein